MTKKSLFALAWLAAAASAPRADCGDAERGHVGPLSTSQFIAIFMLIFGLIMFFLPKMLSGRRQADAES